MAFNFQRIKRTSYIFALILLLNACKGIQYYNNKVNPAGLSIILKSPDVFYYNQPATDSIEFLIVNHNTSAVVLPHWWTDLWVVGNSRFYNKEILIRPQPLDLRMQATTVEPGDTMSLIKIPMNQLLSNENTWLFNNKPHQAPHKISKNSFYPYIRLAAEYRTTIPNQTTNIKIRSSQQKISITKFTEAIAKSKVVNLTLTSDQNSFNVNQPAGNLICKIENTGTNPIQLFNDAGSVRFKIYAYNPNRTSIMTTEMVLDNGKLPLSPVTISQGNKQQFSIPMDQLFFKNPPQKPIFYWTWKKKSPPISPLIYGKSDLATETECWFGIVIDGIEYLSNTIRITFIINTKKK